MESQSTLSSFVSSSSLTEAREVWTAVDYLPNAYRKSYKSEIWNLGTEFVSNNGKTAWKYSIYDTLVVLPRKALLNITRHLRKKHRIITQADKDEVKGTRPI